MPVIRLTGQSVEGKVHKVEMSPGMHDAFMYGFRRQAAEEKIKKEREAREAAAKAAFREKVAEKLGPNAGKLYLILNEFTDAAQFWGESGSVQCTLDRDRYREIVRTLKELEDTRQNEVSIGELS